MLRLDFSAFERKARELDASIDQVPFALAQAMNQAVKNAREVLVQDTWPRHVQQRNKNFIRAALRVQEWANKRSLRVVLGENPALQGRGNLALHAKGGSKRPRGSSIAVPSQELQARRSAKGVPKGMRPANLPNSFKKGDVLYQRVGPKRRKLKLVYTLKPSTKIKADVPFEADFQAAFLADARASFPAALARAMKSRRR